MDYQIRQDNLPYKNETDLIINAAIEVHKDLGCGFLEIVYKMRFVSNLIAEDIITSVKSNILYIIKIICCHIVFMPTSLFLIQLF